ncbi:MAG: Ppx/GppA phosphatase family protein [Ornithinimicrobium sp.]
MSSAAARRVAAIDCGTNSIRLLIADIDEGASGRFDVADVQRRMEIVRLGHGVDATGRFDPHALKRTLNVAGEYAQLCREAEVTSVRFIATSATRDASNADEFIAGVQQLLGDFEVTPEVISGQTEAAFSFAGATAELGGAGEHDAPYLVVDIGGGSTEFVRGQDSVVESCSVDIGCVRLSERHLAADPPNEDQVWAALADITTSIEQASTVVDFTDVATVIGLAGSVTTVTARALDLSIYDPDRIHGSTLPVLDVIAATNDLMQMSRSQRAALPYMHPGRIDVIGAGALIWRTIVQRLVRDAGITEVRTSEHDILDGIALSQIASGPLAR